MQGAVPPFFAPDRLARNRQENLATILANDGWSGA
jgi:hypothetical protein